MELIIAQGIETGGDFSRSLDICHEHLELLFAKIGEDVCLSIEVGFKRGAGIGIGIGIRIRIRIGLGIGLGIGMGIGLA